MAVAVVLFVGVGLLFGAHRVPRLDPVAARETWNHNFPSPFVGNEQGVDE